jgi:hypothetical protein
VRTSHLWLTTTAELRGYKNEKDWSGEFGGRNLTRNGGILRGLYLVYDTESEFRFNDSRQ